jgi:hypothetical protein
MENDIKAHSTDYKATRELLGSNDSVSDTFDDAIDENEVVDSLGLLASSCDIPFGMAT